MNGGDASNASRGALALGEDYYTIGYNREMADWLQRCIELAARYPLVRETLIQYQHLINQLTTNEMDKNSQEELLKVMTDPKNIDTICNILNVGATWRERIFHTYVLTPLKEKLNNGWDIVLGNKGFRIRHANWKYWISINCGNALGQNAWIGITTNIPGPKKVQQLDCFSGPDSHAPCEGEENWPYGWKLLEDKYRYWNVSQMIDGSLAEYLYQYINKILKEIEEKQLPM